jgi:hypothetical protein
MPEPIVMNLGMYVIAPKAYLGDIIHKYLSSVMPTLQPLSFLME